MSNETEAPQKKRVAAYIRVSTEEQAKEGYGLDVQLKYIKHAIAAREVSHGWVYDEKLVYRDEGQSGSLLHRPALDKLMADVEKNKIDVVIVWRIDRLFRRMRYLLETVEKITEKGVMFQSASEPFDTTAVGQMVFQIFGVLAEFERNLIKIRTSEGKLSSAESGNYVGGQQPFGYRIEEQYVDKRRVSRKLVICEEEAYWVRKMFYWFVERDWAIEKIVRLLNKKKVKTNADKEHTRKGLSKRRKHPIGYWSSTTVRRKLQNETYIGKYYYNKNSKNEKGKVVENPKNKWTMFTCPAIITDDRLFQRAREKFKVTPSNNAKHRYLLSGKVVCGLCGSSYIPYRSSKLTKNYRCNKNNLTKTSTKCNARQISEKILGNAVWDYVANLLQNPKKIFDDYHRILKQDSVYQDLLDEKKETEQSLKDAIEKRKRVITGWREGGYDSIEDYNSERAIANEEVTKLEEELAEVNAQLNTEEAKETKIESVREMKEKYDTQFKRLSYEDKREILQAIVDKVIIKGEDIKVVLIIPKTMQDELNKLKDLYGVTGRD
ncbi:MAG: recombinase family protein [Candidatus Peribacteraceae bacterium]|nr:recombinase family protein [Candidatus Peribacteraceae bacterium]MDD5739252.1 recombinase family protein [Candidatus Peribacteraceae bacterium]